MNIQIKSIEILPLIKHYMQELGLARIFDKYVPKPAGVEIAPAQVLSLMTMNLMVSAKPLYRVEDWLHDYLDGVTEERIEAAKYNDDRLGRTLDLLFDADRASLLSELSSNAIRVHNLETTEIHNDTTSITLTGAYDKDDPEAAKIVHGYNKDHRPDCKQVVFGLNVTADGYVPLSYRLFDGNQADVSSHLPNWTQLREQLGKTDFIYVADSKLCAYENLRTIAAQGGRFITVVPRNFREVKEFLTRVEDGEEIVWQTNWETPDSRKKGGIQRYRIHAGECLREGYRVLWVHSESKARLECSRREQQIVKAEQALKNLTGGLNQRRMKTRETIEQAVKSATQGAGDYFLVQLREETVRERVQVGRGRPGPNTCYEEHTAVRYYLSWERHTEAIVKAQRSDGLFPLVDNTGLDPIEVLRTYKNQPYLEKRFYTQKSVLEVAPVFLKTPRRIEAMMLLYFIALMLVSLIERRLRLSMREEEIVSLPLRPDGARTKKPTWRTLVDTFHGVYLAAVIAAEQCIHTTLKGLNTLRERILRLLQVPIETYIQLSDQWWVFALS
jgi:transposase